MKTMQGLKVLNKHKCYIVVFDLVVMFLNLKKIKIKLRTVANNGVTQYTPAYREKFMIRRNLKISLIKIKVNQVKTTTLAIECCFFFLSIDGIRHPRENLSQRLTTF